MKKFIVALALCYTHPILVTAQYNLASVPNSFSNETSGRMNEIKPRNFLAIQRNDSTEKHDYNYYMRKRRRNKNTGWILLGSGFALIGIAALVSETNNNNNNYENNSGSAAAACLVASGAAGIASIPFMILASVNKNKAKALISTQQTSTGTSFPHNHVTGLTMAWRLGK